jgi:hypothetical protein
MRRLSLGWIANLTNFSLDDGQICAATDSCTNCYPALYSKHLPGTVLHSTLMGKSHIVVTMRKGFGCRVPERVYGRWLSLSSLKYV